MARKNKNFDNPRGNMSNASDNELYGDVEYVYEDENHGINLRSMKKAGRYLIMSILLCLIAVGLIAGYKILYNSSIVSAERACWVTEEKVEELADLYVEENGLSSYPTYVEDIPGYENVISECTRGGSYTWNPVTGKFTCSEHEHYPDGYFDAQATKTGQNKVAITNNNNSNS